MPELRLIRWTMVATLGACLLAVAGCEAMANAPRSSTGVCYSSNGKIDARIVYESDCYQTGGTWEDRPAPR